MDSLLYRVTAYCLLPTAYCLDPAKTHFLSSFVDTYLQLREEEQKKFDEETQKLPKREREKVMELTTSWKEEGIQIGLQRGLQQGLQQGSTVLVLRQLKKRFAKLAKKTETRIQKLPTEKVQELREALLDFKDRSDLDKWLSKVSNN
jgi:flagellar biosynthesis/type III secretory pathway protein FliH